MLGHYKMSAKHSSTNFLNSLKRRIHVGERGGYFAHDAQGKKVYGAKALYRKVGSGDVTKIINHAAVPSPIRRKVRSNKGVARGPREGMTASPKKKAVKPAAKNVMVFSPGGTLYKSLRSMMALKKRPVKSPKKKVKKVSLRGLKNKNPYKVLRGM